MPRHGPHTTPHMTDKHREAAFASGHCPYCLATDIQVSAAPRQLSQYHYEEKKYTCQVCGAMGTFRRTVRE